MPTEAEWLTRKSRIDTRLKQKGWKLIQFSPGLDLTGLDKIAVPNSSAKRRFIGASVLQFSLATSSE
jgi:hypothetical protein